MHQQVTHFAGNAMLHRGHTLLQQCSVIVFSLPRALSDSMQEMRTAAARVDACPQEPLHSSLLS